MFMSEGVYSDLEKVGVNIDELKKLNPTERQLQDLLDGLRELHSKYASTEAG
jgi:hypothetical protein